MVNKRHGVRKRHSLYITSVFAAIPSEPAGLSPLGVIFANINIRDYQECGEWGMMYVL